MPTVLQKELSAVQYDYTLDMYRQKAKEAFAKSEGLERYIYKLFGSDIIGSIACAIDPWSRFRFPVVTVTPVNRTRTFVGIAAASRSYYYGSHNETIYDTNYPAFYQWTDSSNSGGPQVSGAQKAIEGWCKDTTIRTRGINSSFGEFELFVPKFQSSGMNSSFYFSSYVWYTVDPGHYQRSRGNRVYRISRIGPSYVISKDDISPSKAQSRANVAMAKYSLGLVSKSLPTSRRFNLAYQLGELKDFPQMISGTIMAWKDFERLVGKKQFLLLLQNASHWTDYYKALLEKFSRMLNVYGLDKKLGNHYLCFKFGWESLISAIQDLVNRPARISNDINRLISRNGLATTFRSSMKWIEKDDNPPLAYLDYIPDEQRVSPTTSSGTRECELRCMVNATFAFPLLDVPKLRHQLWWRKLGLDLGPSDIYDLIPWTWLIDWFSGIGDYVHAMDAIYQDRSLINFGFITYREISNSTSSTNLRVNSSWNKVIEGVRSEGIIPSSYTLSADLSVKYVLRKSLASVAGIKTPTSGSLTSIQKVILAALIAAKSSS